jgi:DNA-binding response OmpR family regulator
LTDHDLEDRNILIVEDDLLIAMDLERTLNDAGCIVVGFVPSVARAMAKIDNNRIDAALLDVTLGGEMAFPVADRLSAEGIPFIFVTAKPSSVPEHYGTHPVITKPYSPPAVLEALATVMREAA